jgi:hypothetical protein
MASEICVQLSSETVLSHEGRPIWPVCDDQQLEALRRLADCFEATLRVSTEGRPDPVAAAGEGLVLALASELEPEARLYAHLTGRRWSALEDPSALTPDAAPDVVIGLREHVHDDLLHRLYGRGGTAAPGLVFAESLADLREQVLIRSAAALLTTSPRVRHVDVIADGVMARHVSSSGHVLGKDAPLEECRGSLSAGAGVLTLTTHSGGIDASLPSNAVLCPADGVTESWDPGGAPSCQLSGMCVVRQKPIDEARRAGELVSPDIIRARIMLLNTCWGLGPPSDLIDWTWSVCRRLLSSARLGSLITSWSLIRSSRSAVSALVDAITRGVPIGEAVAAHNRGVSGWEAGLFCIIGDPRVRLPQQRSDLTGSVPPARQSPLPPVSRRSGNAAVLRFCLSTYSAVAEERCGEATYRALDALDRYQLSTYGRTLGEPLAAGMRTAVCQHFLSQSAPPFQFWSDLSYDCQPVEGEPRCYACGRLTQSYEHALRVPAAPARRVSICPNCGIIEDVPSGIFLGFDIERPGIVHLMGDLPRTDWAGTLVVEQSMTRTLAWEWPAQEDGAPTRSFRTPEHWPVGPFRIAIVLLWGDAEFAALGRIARLDPRVAPRQDVAPSDGMPSGRGRLRIARQG